MKTQFDRQFGLRLSLMGMLMVLTGACAPRMMKQVSFLSEEVPFRTDPQDKDVLLYHNPNLRVTSYSKFLIDPVKIFSNESHGIKPEEQAQLAESFRKQLVEVLQSGYRIVDKPGPGVLRIRTAIQDIQPSHVELDEDKFIVLRLDTLLARVAMELECVDSVSGERVAALIHTLYDRRYFEKGTTARLLNIRDAFSIWTKSLRARFDAAKARPEGGFEGLDKVEERRLRFEEGE